MYMSANRAHLRRWEETIYHNDVRTCLEFSLQRTERRILYLSAEEPFVPPLDVLILHDHKLSSRDDVMVYLIGLCPPSIGESLILPLDPMLRVTPALGALYLPCQLPLKSLEALLFSD